MTENVFISRIRRPLSLGIPDAPIIATIKLTRENAWIDAHAESYANETDRNRIRLQIGIEMAVRMGWERASLKLGIIRGIDGTFN